MIMTVIQYAKQKQLRVVKRVLPSKVEFNDWLEQGLISICNQVARLEYSNNYT